jgi:predicted transcriptional regulator
MAKRMDDIIKYLRASGYRRAVLNAMGPSITSPEKIASRTDLRVANIKPVLKSLMKKGLIRYVGKTGKQELYEATSLGKAAIEMRNQWGHLYWKGTSKQRRISRPVTQR